MALLILPPFADRHGRAARHLFVARVFRSSDVDPADMSGFAGCFSRKSSHLHFALKALRLGEPNPRFDLYACRFRSAKGELREVHAELPHGSVGGSTPLEVLREYLASRML